MRLPILCGILAAVCLFGAHDWWELRTAREEERQAKELKEVLQEKLAWNKRWTWEPPFGELNRIRIDAENAEATIGSRWTFPTSLAALVVAAGKRPDGNVGYIMTDPVGRVILAPESIRMISLMMLHYMDTNTRPMP